MDCVASAFPYWQLGIAHCNSQTNPSAMHTLKMLLPNAWAIKRVTSALVSGWRLDHAPENQAPVTALEAATLWVRGLTHLSDRHPMG
eukprot:scaffold13370_cov63-Phaeocystis_antarctica.AAC.3